MGAWAFSIRCEMHDEREHFQNWLDDAAASRRARARSRDDPTGRDWGGPVPAGADDTTAVCRAKRAVWDIEASLAGGMIAAGGKAISPEEAVRVWREVRGAIS